MGLVTKTNILIVRQNNEYIGHEDQYTHCSSEQRMKCKFYFHKYKTGSYKSGTYKGLDITMSPDNQTYFGILIRSIQEQTSGQLIEGPCRSVNQILSHFNCIEVRDFMNDKPLPLDIYDQKYQFYIQHSNQLEHRSIYKGPRIGLSDKYPSFRMVPYRYATLIQNIKKQRSTLSLMKM